MKENSKNEIQILIQIHSDHSEQSRFNKTQRSTITSILMSISTLLITLTLFDTKLDKWDVPLGIFIVSLGIFGVIFCHKSNERISLHNKLTKAYKLELDKFLNNKLNDNYDKVMK